MVSAPGGSSGAAEHNYSIAVKTVHSNLVKQGYIPAGPDMRAMMANPKLVPERCLHCVELNQQVP